MKYSRRKIADINIKSHRKKSIGTKMPTPQDTLTHKAAAAAAAATHRNSGVRAEKVKNTYSSAEHLLNGIRMSELSKFIVQQLERCLKV